MKTINICIAIFLILLTINIASAGNIGQWASFATASSEWSSGGWSAMQATGAPDTSGYGDILTAWAPRAMSGTIEWLELEYGILVLPNTVRVHETWGAGSLIKVELKNDGTGNWETVWEGTDPNYGENKEVWSVISFPERNYPSKVVRLTINTDAELYQWEEIDAVELIGNSDITVPIPEVPTIMMVPIGMLGLLYIGNRKK